MMRYRVVAATLLAICWGCGSSVDGPGDIDTVDTTGSSTSAADDAPNSDAPAPGGTTPASNAGGDAAATPQVNAAADAAANNPVVPGSAKFSWQVPDCTNHPEACDTFAKWDTHTTFTVPVYTTLTVRVWGGGGGNGLYAYAVPYSRFGDLAAQSGSWDGTGGIAAGGDININGAATTHNVKGGDAPFGGVGAAVGDAASPCGTAAQVPGGGAVNGGGGAYVEMHYQAGELAVGSVIQVTVAMPGVSVYGGGCPNGGAISAAPGQVEVSWE